MKLEATIPIQSAHALRDSVNWDAFQHLCEWRELKLLQQLRMAETDRASERIRGQLDEVSEMMRLLQRIETVLSGGKNPLTNVST